MENEIIHFNVGGTLYDVARETLLKFENTMLATLVSDKWRISRKEEIIFIDRDGERFKYILDWYRDGKINIPKTVNINRKSTKCFEKHHLHEYLSIHLLMYKYY
jgi:hypothetical protein